jgi:hypothetical protein
MKLATKGHKETQRDTKMMLATKRHKKAQKINKTTYLRVLRVFVVKNSLTVNYKHTENRSH